MNECKNLSDLQGALSDAINDMAQFKEFLRDIRPFVGDNINERDLAVLEFCGRYIDGGRFVVYNSRNQFLADFAVLDDAIYYKEENEPKNELFSIECEI